jgi:cell division protein FtsB
MKTDLKSILLYAICALFLASLFLNIRGCGRESYDELQKKYEEKQKSLDSLRYANVYLKKEAQGLTDAISKRDAAIMDLRLKVDSVSRVVASQTQRADRLQRELDKTDEEIKKLRKNPIRRNDQDLIDSFKNRFNKP